MYCNPDVCPNCQYLGQGDSMCDLNNEIVLEDWEPTESYMAPPCPYRIRHRRKKGRKKAAKEKSKRD